MWARQCCKSAWPELLCKQWADKTNYRSGIPKKKNAAASGNSHTDVMQTVHLDLYKCAVVRMCLHIGSNKFLCHIPIQNSNWKLCCSLFAWFMIACNVHDLFLVKEDFFFPLPLCVYGCILLFSDFYLHICFHTERVALSLCLYHPVIISACWNIVCLSFTDPCFCIKQ